MLKDKQQQGPPAPDAARCRECEARKRFRMPRLDQPVATNAMRDPAAKPDAIMLFAGIISEIAEEIEIALRHHGKYARVDLAEASNLLQDYFAAQIRNDDVIERAREALQDECAEAIKNGFGKALHAAVEDERTNSDYKRLRQQIHDQLLERVQYLSRRERTRLKKLRDIHTSAQAQAIIDKAAFESTVVECVERLPKKLRTVILLRYFEKRPIDVIAGVLGVSVSSVKRLHRQARNMLEEMLDDWHARHVPVTD